MRNFLSSNGMFGLLFSQTLRRQKKWLVLLYLLFLAGLICGLIWSGYGRTVFFFDYSADYILVIFDGKVTVWSLIARRILSNLQFFLLLFLCSLTAYGVTVKVVFLFYRGYVLGATAVSLVVVYQMTGALYCLLLVMPFQFFLMAVISLSVCFSQTYARCFTREKNFRGVGELALSMLVYYLFSLLGVIYEVIMIFLILRPFNLAV